MHIDARSTLRLPQLRLGDMRSIHSVVAAVVWVSATALIGCSEARSLEGIIFERCESPHRQDDKYAYVHGESPLSAAEAKLITRLLESSRNHDGSKAAMTPAIADIPDCRVKIALAKDLAERIERGHGHAVGLTNSDTDRIRDPNQLAAIIRDQADLIYARWHFHMSLQAFLSRESKDL